MPENSDSSSGQSTKIPPDKQKNSSSSSQVQDSAARLAVLTKRLKKKEAELSALNQKTRLVDELRLKLRQAEQLVKDQSERIHAQEDTIEKLGAVLHEHRESELADELSARLQELEIQLASVSLKKKHVLAQDVVKTHMIAGMTFALLPAPLFDIAALTGTQLNLLRSLSRHYAVDFEEHAVKAVLTSLWSGALPVLAVVGLSSVVKFIPGIGTIGGSVSVTTLGGAMIYATGQVFIRHFEAGGTFQNFDAKHWQSFLKQQFDEGKHIVKNKQSK